MGWRDTNSKCFRVVMRGDAGCTHGTMQFVDCKFTAAVVCSDDAILVLCWCGTNSECFRMALRGYAGCTYGTIQFVGCKCIAAAVVGMMLLLCCGVVILIVNAFGW